MKLTVSRAAAADLARLRDFLADKSLPAAQRAIAAIAQAIDSLVAYPDRGRPSDVEGLRELVVPFGGSAYIIRFEHDRQREEVLIIRIWHGREARE